MFLEISQNSQEKTCATISFLIKLQAWGLQLYKETVANVFSCEFCEISRNAFFTEHVWTTASISNISGNVLLIEHDRITSGISLKVISETDLNFMPYFATYFEYHNFLQVKKRWSKVWLFKIHEYMYNNRIFFIAHFK